MCSESREILRLLHFSVKPRSCEMIFAAFRRESSRGSILAPCGPDRSNTVSPYKVVLQVELLGATIDRAADTEVSMEAREAKAWKTFWKYSKTLRKRTSPIVCVLCFHQLWMDLVQERLQKDPGLGLSALSSCWMLEKDRFGEFPILQHSDSGNDRSNLR